MVSNFVGILVAIAVVGGMYASLEIQAGNPLFIQEKLAGHDTAALHTAASDHNSPDQIEAILQLGNRPGDLSRTVPMLAEKLMSHDPLAKQAAHSSLEAIGAPAAEHLKEFFDRDTMDGYRIGCSGVRAVGPACKIYMPKILDLLRSDDPIKRRCGLFALQGMGDEALAAIDDLIDCIHDEDFNNQCSACRIIEGLGANASRAEPALKTLLEVGNPSTRGWAATCLGAIGPTTTADYDLVELLASKLDVMNPIEKQRILNGLSYLGLDAKAAAPAVEPLMLQTRDRILQGHAALAYWKITGQADRPLGVIRELIKDNNTGQEGNILAGMMGSDGLPLLADLVVQLKNEDPGIRESAVEAIASFGVQAESAYYDLEKAANDSDPLVRIAARRAMTRVKTK